MSKFRKVGAVVGAIQFLFLGSAGAAIIPFSNTYDWAANAGPPTNSTFTDGAVPTWTHNVSFSPSATSIVSAFLDIRALGNGTGTPCNNTNELWFGESSSSVFIGNLSCSNAGTGWVVDTFAVPGSLFPVLPTSGWTLSLRLGEGTDGTDTIALDYATLRGNYDDSGVVTDVPEPGTLALLGLGLLGLGLTRRKMY